jgi:hypothetical protein
MRKSDRASVNRDALLRHISAASLLCCVACSSRAHDSAAAFRDALPACDSYATDLHDCMSRSGADAPTLSRQLNAMRTALLARATTESARTEVNQSCVVATQRINKSCPSATAETALTP